MFNTPCTKPRHVHAGFVRLIDRTIMKIVACSLGAARWVHLIEYAEEVLLLATSEFVSTRKISYLASIQMKRSKTEESEEQSRRDNDLSCIHVGFELSNCLLNIDCWQAVTISQVS